MRNRAIRATCYVSRLCSIVFLVSTMGSPFVFAQNMGANMGGMGGLGGMNAAPDPPPPTDSPTAAPKRQNPFTADAAPVETIEARTAALEKFIFGCTQGSRPMKQRVQRLEKKLVPYEHHEANEDLNARVDHLWSILSTANKQPEKPPAQ